MCECAFFLKFSSKIISRPKLLEVFGDFLQGTSEGLEEGAGKGGWRGSDDFGMKATRWVL